MADYVVLYEGGAGNWQERSPEEIQKVMEQWGAWFKRLEAEGVLRNPGAALSKGGAVVKRNGKGFVTDTSMAEVKELIGGYTVIAASSLEQATKIAEGSPFLVNNPQGRIRVQPVWEPKA